MSSAYIIFSEVQVTPNSTCNSFFSLSLQVIDGCAFRVYGHWVKKGEGQNRAALFENTPKIELKHIYVSNLSR